MSRRSRTTPKTSSAKRTRPPHKVHRPVELGWHFWFHSGLALIEVIFLLEHNLHIITFLSA